MSQKTDEIVCDKDENSRYIGAIFNLAQFQKVSFPKNSPEKDIFNEKVKAEEDKLYYNIVSGLETDMENLGMDVTYSAKIFIGEIAMNLLFLQRVKASLICKDLLVEKKILKKSYGSIERSYDYPSRRISTYNSYDYYPTNNESVHPVFERLVPQLQKQINNGLKSLGLLPVQQIERQKLTIVKKLRQRCENLNKEYTVKAEAEKNVIKKENLNRKNKINYCST